MMNKIIKCADKNYIEFLLSNDCKMISSDNNITTLVLSNKLKFAELDLNKVIVSNKLNF